MKHTLIALIALVLSFIGAVAQKSVKVSTEYTFYAPESMSVDQAKRTAVERAQIQAIADEFGTIVSQSNTSLMTSRNGESDNQFISIGGSDVKGEWIETIGQPEFNVAYADNMLIVKVKIKGVIRPLSNKITDITARTLRNGKTLKFEATDFRNGDDLFLYFKTPVDGFLSVFLFDVPEKYVYSILPYSHSNGEPVPVDQDTEYIFFSDEHRYNNSDEIDEYTLTASSAVDYNEIYVVFSPHSINKATLTADQTGALPKSLSFDDFNKWLAGMRKQFNDLTVVKIPITIRGK